MAQDRGERLPCGQQPTVDHLSEDPEDPDSALERRERPQGCVEHGRRERDEEEDRTYLILTVFLEEGEQYTYSGVSFERTAPQKSIVA